MDIDPYANDPGRWAHSLVHLTEIVVPCLDAAGARSVVEVGAYAGDLTRVLADRAARSGGRVWAIDPSPQEQLVRLERERDELELVRETSLDALPHIPLPDAVVIDGDHNWYTVTGELRLVAERAEGGPLPLLLFHDVCWRHGRRDDYYAPELIPESHRRPIAEGGGLFPGVTGIRPGGLPYRGAAAEEGGPRNGVLTAVEDFVAGRDDLRLAVVPVFFGLGAVWQDDAPWSQALAETLAPWDRNPLLERLEANRVLHLAVAHFQFVEASRCQERAARQGAVLRRLLESSAFAVAERLSRLRQHAGIARAQSVVSKDEIRRALAD
jgi:SAM-dependent methyltransferase